LSDSVINLRLIRPGEPDENITVQGDSVMIGRSLECDVRIDQPYVSKRHVRIFRGYVVIDLDSRNGTYIEGVRVTEPTLLDGTRISLGDHDAIVEIIRDDESLSPSLSMDAVAEIERLRKRNQELSKLVMHLEDELADVRRNDSNLDETVEIRQTLQQKVADLEASRMRRASQPSGVPSSATVDELEIQNQRQLETLKRVEAELAEARKQLEELNGQ